MLFQSLLVAGLVALGSALLWGQPLREPLPIQVAASLRSHNSRSPIDLSPDGEWLAHTYGRDETVPRRQQRPVDVAARRCAVPDRRSWRHALRVQAADLTEFDVRTRHFFVLVVGNPQQSEPVWRRILVSRRHHGVDYPRAVRSLRDSL